MGIGALVLAMSVGSILLLASGFLPAQDTARSLLSIELPPGSRLSDTEDVTEDIVKLLRTARDHHRIRQWRPPARVMEVRKAPSSSNTRRRRSARSPEGNGAVHHAQA
jgi:multidrug efflux pump subunit AcrB